MQHIFTSPTGAPAGSERYFEEAIKAGYYGVPDDESYAFTMRKPLDPEPWALVELGEDPATPTDRRWGTLSAARAAATLDQNIHWSPGPDFEQDPAFYPFK